MATAMKMASSSRSAPIVRKTIRVLKVRVMLRVELFEEFFELSDYLVFAEDYHLVAL